MKELPQPREFEWDRANLDKSYQKHGITPKEAEEVFLDEKLLVVPAMKHTEKEARFIAIGETVGGKALFVVFTMRGQKIRIISARKAHRKERTFYEAKETEKDPQV